MLSKEYIAGFVDGEGCISTNGRGSGGYLTVTIANSHLGVLETIQQEYGGSISQRKSGSYTLTMSTQFAYRFLVAISPYLIVKKDVAIAGMELAERPRENSNCPERVAIRLRIQQLNRATNPSRVIESHDARIDRERKEAFELAEVDDPTEYEDDTYMP